MENETMRTNKDTGTSSGIIRDRKATGTFNVVSRQAKQLSNSLIAFCQF